MLSFIGWTRQKNLLNLLRRTRFVIAVDCGVMSFSHLLKGVCLVENREFDMAIEELNMALKYNPYLADAYCELAVIHVHKGHLESAFNLYNKTIETDISKDKSATARALRGIGFIFTEVGLLKEAKEAYNDSLFIEPDNPLALNELEYIRKLEYERRETT